MINESSPNFKLNSQLTSASWRRVLLRVSPDAGRDPNTANLHIYGSQIVIIKCMLYGLIVCNIIMFGVLLLNFNHLPPQIPLFFSRPWGEDQLADTWLVLVLPFLLNVLYFINLSLYKRFFSGNDFVKKIVDYLNVFLMITTTSIFVKIITLIT